MRNEVMSFDPRLIVGTWRSELSSDPSQSAIFQILEDFRYISFAEDTCPDARRKWIPLRLRGSFENGNVYRLRPTNEAAGWTRSLSFDGDVLVFKAPQPDHKEWRCRKLADEEIPDWFKAEAASAILRPWR